MPSLLKDPDAALSDFPKHFGRKHNAPDKQTSGLPPEPPSARSEPGATLTISGLARPTATQANSRSVREGERMAGAVQRTEQVKNSSRSREAEDAPVIAKFNRRRFPCVLKNQRMLRAQKSEPESIPPLRRIPASTQDFHTTISHDDESPQ
jgi:hypothetical protein